MALTKDIFIQRSINRHGNRYGYHDVIFKGVNTAVEIECPIHGIFLQKPVYHMGGSGCPKCSYQSRSKSRSDTADSFIKKAKARHGDRYDYSAIEYVNSKTNVTIVCPIHGEFIQSPAAHIRKNNPNGCPTCASVKNGIKQRLSQQEWTDRCIQQHGDCYDYSDSHYRGKSNPITIICKTHGSFEQLAGDHMNGSGCPKCSDKHQHTTDEWIDKCNTIHNSTYNYESSQYTGSHQDIIIDCPQHGQFNQKAYSHLQGHGCPQCNPGVISKAEYKLLDAVDDGTLVRNSRTIIPPIELDGYFPDHKLAIEYCGLYWHSELMGKDRYYHSKKRKRCEDIGIKLITVFEDEWLNRPDIVINRIKHAMNLSTNRVYARKCIVSEIDLSTAREFLNQYHLQGYTGCRFRYGLFYNDNLVSVMTFSKPNRAKGMKKIVDDVYEISRFASSVPVVGGGSKLLRKFERECNPQEIFTFADLRWGIGDGYLQMGFEFVHDSLPNYWYFEGLKRIHRFALRKNDSDDPNMTEWENRKKQGWNRIWDCGHRKFKKTYLSDPW